MRALREKVGPRRENEDRSPVNKEDTDKSKDKEADKKEAERRKVEQTRDVMALEQLVESNEVKG
jgi:hypothetical protein